MNIEMKEGANMELQVFKNEKFGEVRTVEIESDIWFVGKDVAEILGYERPDNAIRNHVDNEDKLMHQISALGQSRSMTLINESGLYSLILKSKLPNAKQFKRWVTSEVLPAIRKHGAYLTDKVAYDITHDKEALSDLLLMAGQQLKEKERIILSLEADKSRLVVENTTMQPKADYFDELVDKNLLTGIRETAKQLNVKQKKFVNFLLDKKYLYRDKRGKLQPYADKNDGLFELKETINQKSGWTGTQLLITPKGRETFRLLCI